MNKKIAGSVAAVALLAMGAAACGSSSNSGGSAGSAAKTGKTLTIVTSGGPPTTQNFNPFAPASTGLGYFTHAVNLYNEPLMVFDTQKPTAKPTPELATNYSWSPDGKTLTVTTRSGVKWSDGKAFSSKDVAYTFNLIKSNQALNANWTTPIPTSVTTPNATTTVLSFAGSEVSNTYYILQVPIVPQHVWQSAGDPAKYTDANPVSDGPYVLDQWSSTGFTMKANPDYYGKSTLTVPEVSFPSYAGNANLLPPCADGTIDWCGVSIIGAQQNYLAKSSQNGTWDTAAPYFSDNNVVGLFFNVNVAPLNDPAVRQAVEYGINRQQLSTTGESNNEPPVTSTAGMLPSQDSYLPAAMKNNLPATGSSAKVTSILTADGYAKVGNFWEKNGKKISFSIEDPTSYTDYYQDSQLIQGQLNKLGFDVTLKADGGTAGPTTWSNDMNDGDFQAAIRWGAQGLTPYFTYNNWMNSNESAPAGKVAGNDYGRYTNQAADTALNDYAAATTTAQQNSAITQLATIETNDVPVAPLLAGASFAEFSSRDYTGWPTQSNAYTDPGPNIPEMLVVIQHLKPVSS